MRLLGSNWHQNRFGVKKPLLCNINKKEMKKCQIITYLQMSTITAQKMKFCIKDFFSKWDQIHLRISPNSRKKSAKKNFIFCAVNLFLPSVEKTKKFQRSLILFENYENDVTKDFTAVKIFDERFSKT